MACRIRQIGAPTRGTRLASHASGKGHDVMAGYKGPAEPMPHGSMQDEWGLNTPEPAADQSSTTGRTSSGAIYTLESPVRCPQCEREIRALRVLRVLRTQVSFTSTLPRKGYVIVCPECDGLLSAELSGLI